jgi:hypothetical protein
MEREGMSGELKSVLDAIDAANARDPNTDRDVAAGEMPAALLYGQRMSAELERLFGPHVSDVLKIAARGQHIERWKIRRADYPEGRVGYLNWRRDQGRAHGERLGGMMADAGYDGDACERVGVLLRKEGLKRDAEVQMLEDAVCLVFLKHYFAEFAEKHPLDKVVRIIAKTARKLSEGGRNRVLTEFDLPEDLANAVRAA